MGPDPPRSRPPAPPLGDGPAALGDATDAQRAPAARLAGGGLGRGGAPARHSGGAPAAVAAAAAAAEAAAPRRSASAMAASVRGPTGSGEDWCVGREAVCRCG
jgi:hypothetical protein